MEQIINNDILNYETQKCAEIESINNSIEIDPLMNLNEKEERYRKIDELKKEENKRFNTLEQKSTASIVKEIIYAVDAKKPRLRYVAPRIQGWAVAFMRAIGK